MEFINRMINEREELENKYSKLKEYLNVIDNKTYDSNDFDLLQKQYEIMGDYLVILNIRIRRAIEKFGTQTDLILNVNNTNNWTKEWCEMIDNSILNKNYYICCNKDFKIYKINNRDSILLINDTNVIPFYKNDIKDINKEKSLKIIKNTQNTGFVNESKC